MSKKKTHEEFVKELKNINPNIEVIGKYVKYKDNIKVRCINCTGEWEPMAQNLLRNYGCPYCANQKILIGFNDMWTTNPELANNLANPEDGYKYFHGSNKKVNFKCPNCGTILKNKSITNVRTHGLSCNKCSDGISYPNKFAFNLLEQLKLNFEYEFSPDWIKPKRYDFYFKVNGKEYILEMDGGLGHGNKNNLNGKTAEETKNIDNYKDLKAKEYGIEVIRIDCLISDLEYIKNNILHSKLNNIFDLNNIDWLKCHEFCMNIL